MEQIFRRKAVRARIVGNPLGGVLQQYIDYLVARGHPLGSTHQYVFAVEHFGNWLGGRAVSHALVARFTSHHLSACRCKKPAVRSVPTVHAALNRLLEMLGLERPRPEVHPVVDRLLCEYEGHLLAVAGLAESTTRYRVFHARNLLQHFEVQRPSQFKRWLATDVADYVARKGEDRKPGSGQQLSSSIRSFLRFLLFKGLLQRDLSPAIPSFANWRLARLPAVVAREDLERLLSAVDATTPIGMRDRAALLCMIELSWFPLDTSFSVAFLANPGTAGDGIVLSGWDYQRTDVPDSSTRTSLPYFPPLRFPGQYYDEETDLHENWNRYYDSEGGRYFSPEPLLQSPAYVRRMAQSGMSVPTYAYANNNPLAYYDSDGLWLRRVSPLLRHYIGAIENTERGRVLMDRIRRSPRAFDFVAGRTGDFRKDGRRVGGATDINQCGGDVRITIDLDAEFLESAAGKLNLVGHETEHGGQFLDYPSGTPEWLDRVLEQEAGLAGMDMMFEVFP